MNKQRLQELLDHVLDSTMPIAKTWGENNLDLKIFEQLIDDFDALALAIDSLPSDH